ncbi:MAG: hypothetical protein JNL70_14680 [Saprospiraceae bacterium]|nr:hypothetical protein [Saprospiraceae bacterium]
MRKEINNLKPVRLRKFSKFPKSFLLLLSYLFFYQNCQQPTEGCLDVRATNFDVTASKGCETQCVCTYPYLITSTDYFSGVNSFSVNTTYKNDQGDSFRIISAQMYLSDFQLINDKNETYRTIDSVALTRETDTIKVLNNYALVGKSNGFDFTIGSFNGTGNFTKVKFRVGLDDVAAKTIASKMPSTHPLSIKTDSMYISSSKQYIFNKFVIAKGLNFKDTLRLNITTPKDLTLTTKLTFKEGFDAKIPLKINYLTFFSGVNFSQSENIILQKIVDNTSSAISIQ